MRERTLIALLLCLALSAGLVQATAASAQTPAPAPSAPAVGGPEASNLGTAIVVGLLVVGILGIVIMVKAVDRWHGRDAEAVRLQVDLGEALMRDARLALLPIILTAQVPFWRGAPAIVEIRGDVPSPELRDAAVRLVTQELRRRDPAGRVEDRVTVLPEVMRRTA
jgi:hypothetical protein